MSQRGCGTGVGGSFVARGVPAGTYYLVVDGDDALTGEFSLDVRLAAPSPVPTNDTCATATVLVPNASQMVDANAAAGDYMYSCSGPSGGDVVYQFTTTMPQKVTVTVTGTGNSDSVVSLRAAPCEVDTNEVSCVDDAVYDPEVITANNLPAGTYYVLVAAYSPSAGQFGVELALDAPVLPPSNDTCSAPATLVPNMSQSIDLGAATPDYTFSCSFVSGGDAVYQFTTTQAQRVVLTATGVGTGADAVLALRAAPCDTSMDLACVNNAFPPNAEVLTRNNLPAGTYYVLLGSNGSDTAFGLELTLDAPRLPPTNEDCTAPEVVTLTAGTAMRNVDLTDAVADLPSDLCSLGSTGGDVVYEVTIPAMQTLTVLGTPVGTVLDPVLFARAPVCATTPSVACIDTGGAGTAETLSVPNTTASPMTVFVVVKAYRLSAPGEINLTFTAM
jgi:hypothetical protein